MISSESYLSRILKREDVELTEKEMGLLTHYASLLRDWNQRINLVSRKDLDALHRNHLLHSLMLLPWFRFSPKDRVLDIGTGGGLPGLPLAITHPETEFILCDSIEKKTKAVMAMVKDLGLVNVTVLRSRVENLRDHLGTSVRYCCARAVTQLDELADWCRPLYRQNEPAVLFAWKGGDTEEEMRRTRKRPFVKDVTVLPSRLSDEPYFLQENKYIIRVDFHVDPKT